jgi:hypothetical protein
MADGDIMALELGVLTPVNTSDLEDHIMECGITIFNGIVNVKRFRFALLVTNGGPNATPPITTGFVLLDDDLPKDILGEVLEVCQEHEWVCGFTLLQAIPYINVFIVGSQGFGGENRDPLENEGYRVQTLTYEPNQTTPTQVVNALRQFIGG